MNTALKTIFVLVGLVALGWLFWQIQAVIVYVMISAVLSLVGNPLVNLLKRIRIGKFKVPGGLAALLTLATMLGILAGFVSIFVPLIAEEVRLISNIDVDQVLKNLEEPLAKLERLLQTYSLTDDPEKSNLDYIKERLGGVFDVTKVGDIFGALVGTLGNIFVALFSISFITFFLLKDQYILKSAVNALTPDKYLDKVQNVLSKAKTTLTRYFIGIIVQITLITTVVTIGLSILGVKNALVIGFFAGLINIIPYVGPIIGAIFGIVVGISTNLELDFYTELIPLALEIALVFGIMQLLDNILFQPLIFSNSVNVHPLEIFLVISIAGSITGIAGMIVAVPAYSFIRIIASVFLSEFKLVRSLTTSGEKRK